MPPTEPSEARLVASACPQALGSGCRRWMARRLEFLVCGVGRQIGVLIGRKPRVLRREGQARGKVLHGAHSPNVDEWA